MPPLVTLTTDFGTTDAYVGIMKGVVLSRCPDAHVIDITHGVAPGNIAQAAYLLSTAWRWFRVGTVHVAVVDPGVGTSRAILAAEVEGHRFVAPDNGLLSTTFAEHPPSRVVRVTNDAFFVTPTSNTFHGRDIFAPVGAALAAGTPLDELGSIVDDWMQLDMPEPSEREGALHGCVVHIDHFGNLITNVRADQLRPNPQVTIGGHVIDGLATSYGSTAPGSLLALIGSTDRLEISVHGGNAARTIDAELGTMVQVR